MGADVIAGLVGGGVSSVVVAGLAITALVFAVKRGRDREALAKERAETARLTLRVAERDEVIDQRDRDIDALNGVIAAHEGEKERRDARIRDLEIRLEEADPEAAADAARDRLDGSVFGGSAADRAPGAGAGE